MVLDAKAMEWAGANEIDTAKLKAAKVPVYGKWYHPDMPAGVPLVNLQTGEIETFGPGLRAGEVLYAPQAELRRARLGPYVESTQPASPSVASANVPTVEPAAGPSAEAVEKPPAPSPDGPRTTAYDQSLAPGQHIHLPGPSIYPLVLAFGLAIALIGVVAGPPEVRVMVVALGLVYLIAGAIGWTLQNYREGQEEGNDSAGKAEHAETARE